MPERNLTVVTYAAGASLAAITLIYVFAPTYFLDSEPNATRKKGVVGLVNPANDCFINSVLQALAGLGDLRLYLIRETHRRNIDDPLVYSRAVPDDADLDGPIGAVVVADPGESSSSAAGKKATPAWKTEGLQKGLATRGLKDILDALNERPIYRKTISATPFVRVLETAFRQKISRQQQDAQELLQVVAERVCDEYHAGRRARRYARRFPPRRKEEEVAKVAPGEKPADGKSADDLVTDDKGKGKAKAVNGDAAASGELTANDAAAGEKPAGPATTGNESSSSTPTPDTATDAAAAALAASVPALQTSILNQEAEEEEDGEDGFPMEGGYESQIECLTCGFKPKPTQSTFCTLTLNVPQQSTSLSACFDTMFKTEYIDDFKCEKCRLLHAKALLETELESSKSAEHTEGCTEAIAKLRQAIDTDPEKPPPDVALPDYKDSPKRRIARHIRLTRFPKVLAIHLSRSIFDAQVSSKNSAKVAFPERLPLGGLLSQQRYKLLGLVTHKGSHQSGHYESFRRQNIYPPFSTPNTFQPSGIYSKSAANSATASPLAALTPRDAGSAVALATLPAESAPKTDDIDGAAAAEGAASNATTSPAVSTAALPESSTSPSTSSSPPGSEAPSGPGSSTPSLLSTLPRPSTDTGRQSVASTSPNGKKSSLGGDASSLRSVAASARSAVSKLSGSVGGDSSATTANGNKHGSTTTVVAPATAKPTPPTSAPAVVKKHRRKASSDRWWRISDDKIKEARTSEVLGMQREVYLLFYELERDDEARSARAS